MKPEDFLYSHLGQPLSLSDLPIFFCALNLYLQKTDAFYNIDLNVFISSNSATQVTERRG